MKKRNILMIVLGVLLIIGSFFIDNYLSEFLGNIRNYFILGIFVSIAHISSELILFVLLTSLFVFNNKKIRYILILWISIGFSAIISFLLKVIIQRPRPYQLGLISTLISETSHTMWNFSFPSFTAMLAFCAIPIISREYPKLKYIWIGFASLIAISRIYLGVHFLSDILFGALIGYLIGFFIIKKENKNKFWEKTYKRIIKKFKK